MNKTKVHVGWPEIVNACNELARLLPENIDYMIAISRGGLVPAGIISHRYPVKRIDTVCMESYSETDEQHSIVILKDWDPKFLEESVLQYPNRRGKGILILDDIVDTGKTFEALRQDMPFAHYASLYAKPEGLPEVDTFICTVPQDTWVVFPWEV